MDAHATNRPIGDGAPALHMNDLETDAFDLLKKRIDYDLRCLKVFRGKMESHSSAQYHAELTHRKNAFDASVIAAKKLLASNVKVLCGNALHSLLQDYNGYVNQFCKTFGLQQDSMVTWLSLIG